MIEHDYFGVLGIGPDEAWSETVETNDQSVSVRVLLENEVDQEALDRAAAIVIALETLDRHARELCVGELASAQTPTSMFVADVMSRVSDVELVDMLDRDSGDRAIDILRSLEFESALIRPERRGEGEAFASFRYVFDPESSGSVLIVELDESAEYVDVRVEAW